MPVKLIVYPNNTWTGNKVCLPLAYALQTVGCATSLHINWKLLKTELPLSRPLFFIQGKKGYMVSCFPRVVCLSLTTYQDLDHISRENKTQGPNSESAPPPAESPSTALRVPYREKVSIYGNWVSKKRRGLSEKPWPQLPQSQIETLGFQILPQHFQTCTLKWVAKLSSPFRKVQRTEIFRF